MISLIVVFPFVVFDSNALLDSKETQHYGTLQQTKAIVLFYHHIQFFY